MVYHIYAKDVVIITRENNKPDLKDRLNRTLPLGHEWPVISKLKFSRLGNVKSVKVQVILLDEKFTLEAHIIHVADKAKKIFQTMDP